MVFKRYSQVSTYSWQVCRSKIPMRTSDSDGAYKRRPRRSSSGSRTTGGQDIFVEWGIVCQEIIRIFPKRYELIPHFNEGWLSLHVGPWIWEKTKCRRGGRINRYPFLVILPFSIETIPMAHALSADRSAVSKSIATSFIAMASLKIQFFTRHREAGTQRRARSSCTFSCQKRPRRYCVSGYMSAPRNACTSVCPGRTRCCFNCAILALASRARARHWSPRQACRRFAVYVADLSLLHRAHRHHLRGLPGHEVFDVRRPALQRPLPFG
jgi:hypothetical protein